MESASEEVARTYSALTQQGLVDKLRKLISDDGFGNLDNAIVSAENSAEQIASCAQLVEASIPQLLKTLVAYQEISTSTYFNASVAFQCVQPSVETPTAEDLPDSVFDKGADLELRLIQEDDCYQTKSQLNLAIRGFLSSCREAYDKHLTKANELLNPSGMGKILHGASTRGRKAEIELDAAKKCFEQAASYLRQAGDSIEKQKKNPGFLEMHVLMHVEFLKQFSYALAAHYVQVNELGAQAREMQK